MSDVLHAVEAAIFLVLAAGSEAAVACTSHNSTVVECGMRGTVVLESDGRVRLPQGVRVDRSKRDAILLSNGVEGRKGATGWIAFTNGLVVRREGNAWRFGGGLVCRVTAAKQARCE